MSVLSLRVPKTSENSPEQTAQLLASLAKATFKPSLFQKTLGKSPINISLEVHAQAGLVSFILYVPHHLIQFAKSQLIATYPDIDIVEVDDPLVTWPTTLLIKQTTLIKQTAAGFFPLRDFADYREVDPMLPLLGVFSKASSEDKIVAQFVLSPVNKLVLSQANAYITPSFETAPDGKPLRELPAEEKQIIKDKLSYPLVSVSIRFASTNPVLLADLVNSISVLNRPDGNSLVPKKHNVLSKNPFPAIRSRHFLPPTVTLNVMELASLWHLPGSQTKIPNISWSSPIAHIDPPIDLPVFSKVSPDHQNLNLFACASFHNQEVKFGIKTNDRLRHMYIIGKTGTGKSTLLENLAIDDFKQGRGVAFLDPHGDSSQNLLNYIPKSRINDTIYFDPSDREHPISINILETTTPDQVELVVSGIISIFQKLYGKFWGPRMQYILRNALLTLVEIPGSTLPDVVKILSDPDFRKSLYPKITNKSLLSFWKKEFDTLEDDVRLQYTYPILNKIGQFVNSPLIQPIIASPHSSIDIGEIMNSGKIFIANLSQGRLGQDNAALLGAMLITKFELAALSRIDTPEADRPNYFLYVDEFQNFATESFSKILSEARKFHLGLVLANQYVAQIPETLQKAIFGNIGTMVSFAIGSQDAFALSHEFSPTFSQESLTNLDKFQIAIKMTIDGKLSEPFSAHTFPPFISKNTHRETVLQESRRRYSTHNL